MWTLVLLAGPFLLASTSHFGKPGSAHIFADDTCIILQNGPSGNTYIIEGALTNYSVSIRNDGGQLVEKWSNLTNSLEIDLTVFIDSDLTIEIKHDSESGLFVSLQLPPTIEPIVWDEFIGSSGTVPFFPDENTNYFTYFFDRDEVEDCVLKVSGEFADARYMNLTLYNNSTRNPLNDIADHEIVPLQGHSNPYQGSNFVSSQKYEIFIGPDHLDLSAHDNVIQFPNSVNSASVFLRYYYPRGGNYGSENLPTLVFESLSGIGKNPPVDENLPIIDESEVIDLIDNISLLFYNIERDRERMFFRVTNSSTGNFATSDNEYLLSPVTLGTDEVVVLRWKAPEAADDFSNLSRAQVRYYSISLSDDDTYTHQSLGDDELIRSPGGWIDLVVSRPDAQIQSAAAGINFVPWTQSVGNRGFLIYRNLLTQSSFSGHIGQVPTVTDIPLLVALLPGVYSASAYIGDYAPQGNKMSKEEFLSNFSSSGED